MLGLILAEMVGLSLVLAKAEKGGADIKKAMKTMNKIARMALVMTVVFTAIGMLSRTDGAGENVAAGLIMTASAIAIFAALSANRPTITKTILTTPATPAAQTLTRTPAPEKNREVSATAQTPKIPTAERLS